MFFVCAGISLNTVESFTFPNAARSRAYLHLLYNIEKNYPFFSFVTHPCGDGKENRTSFGTLV